MCLGMHETFAHHGYLKVVSFWNISRIFRYKYAGICGTLARAKIFLLDIAAAQQGSYLSVVSIYGKKQSLSFEQI